MHTKTILIGILAISVSVLEAREAQQTPYLISQSEYSARKAAYEAGVAYTASNGILEDNYASETSISSRFYNLPKHGVAATPISSNNAAITARPNEELLAGGRLDDIASQAEHSIESSILGKVTSLPASEFSKLQSSVQAKETEILRDLNLNLTSTTSSNSPTETGKVVADGKLANEASEKESYHKENHEKGTSTSAANAIIPNWNFAVSVFFCLIALYSLPT